MNTDTMRKVVATAVAAAIFVLGQVAGADDAELAEDWLRNGAPIEELQEQR